MKNSYCVIRINTKKKKKTDRKYNRELFFDPSKSLPFEWGLKHTSRQKVSIFWLCLFSKPTGQSSKKYVPKVESSKSD